MGKKIGIIIPSYNQGKYLEQTILSVLENKQHVDMQIAVIDGGSTDESIKIIQKYQEQFTFWCSEPDKGQADAINKGIRALPECDYYMWLNSDDVYEDEYAVKKIVDFAEKRSAEVCYGYSHFIDEKGKAIGEYPVEAYSKKNLGKRCYLSQPSVLFSRKAYQMVGELDTSLHMCLDYEYWMRLATKYFFVMIPEFIGCTRMYGETKTATMQQKHLQEGMKILLKYYGKVPMQWVVTKKVTDTSNPVILKLPKRLLMCLLYPVRKKIVEECLKGIENAQNYI